MTLTLTLYWHWPATSGLAALDRDSLQRLREVIATIPELIEAQILTPASVEDPYVKDDLSPPLGLHLTFLRIDALEAACSRSGPLQRLCGPGVLTGLDPSCAEAQAFLLRDFEVDVSHHEGVPALAPCSFVVHYTGPAPDPTAWQAAYIERRPAIMRRMPGIRAIEILTPIDWLNGLPIPTARHLLRNRVLFDSPAALTAALQSPIRRDLRKDAELMPEVFGTNRHVAMMTETIRRSSRP